MAAQGIFMNHRSTRYKNRDSHFGGVRLNIILVTGLLAGMLGGTTWAQAPQDVDRAAQQSQQILQQQQERERQQREQEEARRRTPSGQELTQSPTKPVEASKECSQIKSIALQGATLLSDAELKNLTAPYLNKCLTLADINALIAVVTNAYVQHGYVTARVYIPAQDTASGQLQLLVVEGRLTSLSIKPSNTASAATAFPGLVGEFLNLRDLEQGLDQINRLHSNSATIDIVPGEGPGASQVLINNAADKRVQLGFGVDNSGTRATGLNQYSGSLAYDNALHLNDYINVGVRRSGSDREYSASESVYASVPYGYWTFATALSNFNYASLVTGDVRTFETSGTSESRGVTAERVLYRDQRTKWNVATGLTVKAVHNYIEGEQIETSSHKLSVINIETNVTRFWRGALLSAMVGGDKSVRVFGSQRDEAGLPDDAPHAQYTTYKYGLSVQRTVQLHPIALRWQSELRGQYSPDTLYGTEQLAIGNLFNVRGFRETSISGNRGAYLRNTFGMPFHSSGSLQLQNEPYIGYDIGHIAGEDSISGWAIGWRMTMRYGSMQIEYAQPATNAYTSTSKAGKENGWFYASASVSF
jgi:hemolysin activation/secretion protein